MFFHRLTYKNSYFSELVYTSIVLALMIYSFIDVLKDLALYFGLLYLEGLLLVYIAYPLRLSLRS